MVAHAQGFVPPLPLVPNLRAMALPVRCAVVASERRESVRAIGALPVLAFPRLARARPPVFAPPTLLFPDVIALAIARVAVHALLPVVIAAVPIHSVTALVPATPIDPIAAPEIVVSQMEAALVVGSLQ